MKHRWLSGIALAALFAAGVACAQNDLGPARSLDLPPPALQPLVQGLVHDMDAAVAALGVDGHRREATEALDRARRIARVLRSGAAPDVRQEASAGLDAVERARHALQNGDPAQAREVLRQASHALLGFSHDATASRAVGPADAGMLVADAEGRRLGHLDRIERHDGQWQAVLQVGGVNHVFGFLDWGNHEVRTRAADLVPGDRYLALEWPTTVQDLRARGGRPPPGVEDRP